MGYELLVLDIDGTVTNSEKKVLPKTREAVFQIQRMGVKVVLASGRPPEGVLPVAGELGFDRYGSYILAFNGGKILDVRTGRCVFEKCLPRHLPGCLWEEAVRNQIGMAAYRTGTIVAGTEPDAYMLQESRITGMPVEYRKDFKRYVDFSVNECLLTGEPEMLENLEPVLTRKYFHEVQIFHSEPFYLEVVPKNIDKAYGLKYLLERLKISWEKVVCCGDSYNDINMIRHAGLGVAMANAPEEIQAMAGYITTADNDHDGIAEVIEKFFLSGGSGSVRERLF